MRYKLSMHLLSVPIAALQTGIFCCGVQAQPTAAVTQAPLKSRSEGQSKMPTGSFAESDFKSSGEVASAITGEFIGEIIASEITSEITSEIASGHGND